MRTARCSWIWGVLCAAAALVWLSLPAVRHEAQYPPVSEPAWDTTMFGAARSEPVREDRAPPLRAEPLSIVEPVTREALPQWIVDAVELPPGLAARSNRSLALGDWRNPRHLDVLRDIIEANRLSESSSSTDFDDGDGVFDPLELGFQVWSGGDLVALSFGADPYSSFGYGIERLPPSIGDLDRLQLLDVQSNRLRELPHEIGRLGELRELRAQQNEITDLPSSLSQLTRLRGVHLSRNALTTLPDSIVELRELEWLHVSDNPLEYLPVRMSELRRLRELGLQTTGPDPSRPDAAVEVSAGLAMLPDSLDSIDALYVRGNHLGCSDARSAELLATTGESRIFGLSAQRCAR